MITLVQMIYERNKPFIVVILEDVNLALYTVILPLLYFVFLFACFLEITR